MKYAILFWKHLLQGGMLAVPDHTMSDGPAHDAPTPAHRLKPEPLLRCVDVLPCTVTTLLTAYEVRETSLLCCTYTFFFQENLTFLYPDMKKCKFRVSPNRAPVPTIVMVSCSCTRTECTRTSRF